MIVSACAGVSLTCASVGEWNSFNSIVTTSHNLHILTDSREHINILRRPNSFVVKHFDSIALARAHGHYTIVHTDRFA